MRFVISILDLGWKRYYRYFITQSGEETFEVLQLCCCGQVGLPASLARAGVAAPQLGCEPSGYIIFMDHPPSWDPREVGSPKK